ncbi:hypothetical protein GQX73_g6919 [Xylaria multiplex]|uniref:Aflatoxin regulatory protein domain-containing protein n=1 Tax=Xylaria multiplex TaxID=323545 RepID=A0A7C8N2E3_9PEZI|nr:hypothetical protein GQX73_g6919 [Xylaria multiplex]
MQFLWSRYAIEILRTYGQSLDLLNAGELVAIHQAVEATGSGRTESPEIRHSTLPLPSGSRSGGGGPVTPESHGSIVHTHGRETSATPSLSPPNVISVSFKDIPRGSPNSLGAYFQQPQLEPLSSPSNIPHNTHKSLNNIRNFGPVPIGHTNLLWPTDNLDRFHEYGGVLTVPAALNPVDGYEHGGSDDFSQTSFSCRQYHNCTSLAKNLLNKLNTVTSKNETQQSSVAPVMPASTTDEALVTCSNASKQLLELLECSCDEDAYLPFLVAIIISKVLATYGAIAEVDYPTRFGLRKPISTPQQLEQMRNTFQPAPLRLGVYDIDGDLNRLLRTQLVLREVSKIKQLVDLFWAKYCYGGNSADMSSDGESDRIVYIALGQFVENRYTKILAACERVGMDCSRPIEHGADRSPPRGQHI